MNDMTNQTIEIKDYDLVQPFMLDNANVHGRLVALDQSVHKILSKHDYPELVENLLGEMLTLTTAIASTLKFEGILTLQIRGDGPVSLMVADVQTEKVEGDELQLNLRGYASFDDALVAKLALDASIPKIIGDGSLAFTLDQGDKMERYQGIVALEGATLTDCLTHYFAQSDQFSMAINLAVATRFTDDKHSKGAAITLQRLPSIGGNALDDKDEDEIEDDWRRSVILMGTATKDELLDPELSTNDLLYRLFHDEGVRVFEPTKVRAKCRCSRDRIYTVLKSLSADDIEHAQVDGYIATTCEFCATTHKFAVDDLG